MEEGKRALAAEMGLSLNNNYNRSLLSSSEETWAELVRNPHFQIILGFTAG